MTERHSEEMPQRFDQSNQLVVSEVVANLVRRASCIDEIIERLSYRSYPTHLFALQVAEAQEEACTILAETRRLLSASSPSDPLIMPLHALINTLDKYLADEVNLDALMIGEARYPQDGAGLDFDAPSSLQN